MQMTRAFVFFPPKQVPKADGTMAETRFHIDVDRALAMTGYLNLETLPKASGSTTEDEEDDYLSTNDRPASASHFRRKTRDGSSPVVPPVSRSISMADLAAAELVVAREVEQEEQQQG